MKVWKVSYSQSFGKEGTHDYTDVVSGENDMYAFLAKHKGYCSREKMGGIVCTKIIYESCEKVCDIQRDK